MSRAFQWAGVIRSVFGFGHHAFSAATGRYAGRKAAHYAFKARDRIGRGVAQRQLDAIRARCLAPVRKDGQGVGWKELNVAITRVIQQFCGPTITEHTLTVGLQVLEDLERTEVATAVAANPHELGRLLECHSVITTSKLILNACLARRASSGLLGYVRIDHPEVDPPEWRKWVAVSQAKGGVVTRDVPLDYHLSGTNAPTYEENYLAHREPSTRSCFTRRNAGTAAVASRNVPSIRPS